MQTPVTDLLVHFFPYVFVALKSIPIPMCSVGVKFTPVQKASTRHKQLLVKL